MSAKKAPSITDKALRIFLSDLLERDQVRPGELGRKLGYNNSNELNKFLKGERNFSRKKLLAAIDMMASVYLANKTFLETGHGEMYQGGKPYVNDDNTRTVNDPGNLLSYASRQKIKKLEEELQKQQEKIEHLEQLIKAKDETIHLQRELLAKKK